MSESTPSPDEIRALIRSNEVEREDLFLQLAAAEGGVVADPDGPVCVHIGMPDGSPLCGYATRVGAGLPPDAHAGMDREQFSAWLDESMNGPACGACVMLAGNLRFRATVLRGMTGDRVYPDRPQDAWRLLDATPWGQVVDIRGSLGHMDTVEMSYTWGDYEVDQVQAKAQIDAKNRDMHRTRKAMLERHEAEAIGRRDRGRPDYEDL